MIFNHLGGVTDLYLNTIDVEDPDVSFFLKARDRMGYLMVGDHRYPRPGATPGELRVPAARCVPA